MQRSILLQTHQGSLNGLLSVPVSARGLILVANAGHTVLDDTLVAQLSFRHHALLSCSLLTHQESQFPDAMHNVPVLAQRLVDVLDFVRQDAQLADLDIGLLAHNHATPAAIRAAALRDHKIRAVVCHGGLIDLAGLQNIKCLSSPLLMLFDHDDQSTQMAFHRAGKYLVCHHEMHVLQAGENPVAPVAAWFDRYLG